MSGKQKHDREKWVPVICERLATGEPLSVICRDIGIPRRTVNEWRQTDPAIADLIQDARDDGYDAIAKECLDIADDGRRDYREDEDGREFPDYDHIQRSKLRVETRLKLLAKWDPKRYGDKHQFEHSGPNGGPIKTLNDFYGGLTGNDSGDPESSPA